MYLFCTSLFFFHFSVALLVVGLICLPICHGYMTYQDNIPNGAFVPHPCKPNYIWKGVGHQNVLGGGVRNPFGSDFKDAGYVCFIMKNTTILLSYIVHDMA